MTRRETGDDPTVGSATSQAVSSGAARAVSPATPQAPQALEVDALHVDIQASHILRDVHLSVGDRELVCLVGRNGAGKTTLLRTIMGYLRPARGTVRLAGKDITGWPTWRVARAGVGFAPEESEIFGDLTVGENIELATWTRPGGAPAAERIGLAYEVFPRLRGYAGRGGTQLSGGERKMLSIARALALDAPLLLLDEPFEGLSPAIIPQLAGAIAAITALGRSVLVAESNIHHVPAGTSRLYVVERGEIIFAGPPADAARDPGVLRVIGGAVG